MNGYCVFSNDVIDNDMAAMLCKWFQYICIDAGHASQNTLLRGIQFHALAPVQENDFIPCCVLEFCMVKVPA